MLCGRHLCGTTIRKPLCPADLLRLKKSLHEVPKIITRSLEILEQSNQLVAPFKTHNGPVHYVNMDSRHPWGFRWRILLPSENGSPTP